MGSLGGRESQPYFTNAKRTPPDAIFALTASYLQDTHSQKVNLGQGAYRDENGKPWVLPSVRQAEVLLKQQDGGLNHEYLPILGHQSFRQEAVKVSLGPDLYKSLEDRIATCQALSGTGSLHLVAKLIAHCRSPPPKVYISDPSWSNHLKVFSSAGLSCQTFNYYQAETKQLDMVSYRQMLREVEPGSVVVLHACAHNPTGCDPTREQWLEVGTIMKERRLYPVFDAAYLGFNSGSLHDDAFALRHFVGELGLEASICMSFAKSMGLYGERVGCVMVSTSSSDEALDCSSVMEQIQRSEISNPPAYGAKIAQLVLSDEALLEQWMRDLKIMSGRIREMRQMLYDGLIKHGTPGTWTHLLHQTGMFGFLGLPQIVVQQLKDRFHIYMADNSRISIAGLTAGNVDYVAASISVCVRAHEHSSL